MGGRGIIRTMPENHSLVSGAGIKELMHENPFFSSAGYDSESGLVSIPYNDSIVLRVEAPIEVIKEWCEKIHEVTGVPIKWRFSQMSVGIYVKPRYYRKFLFQAFNHLARANPFYDICLYNIRGNYLEKESEIVRITCECPEDWKSSSMANAYAAYFSK